MMSPNWILRGVYAVALGCACLALAALAVLVNAQIVGRFFGAMIPAADELAVYMLAAATFLAAGPTLRRRVHIRVMLLLDRLPGQGAKRLNVVSHLGALFVVGYLAYFAGELAWDSYRFGALSTGLYPIPLWIPQLALVAGAAVLFVALIEGISEGLWGQWPVGGVRENDSSPADDARQAPKWN